MKRIITLLMAIFISTSCFVENTFADTSQFVVYYNENRGSVSYKEMTNLNGPIDYTAGEEIVLTLNSSEEEYIPVCLIFDGENSYSYFDLISETDKPDSTTYVDNSKTYPSISSNGNKTYTLTYKAKTAFVEIVVNWSFGEYCFEDFGYFEEGEYSSLNRMVRISQQRQGSIELTNVGTNPHVSYENEAKYLFQNGASSDAVITTLTFKPGNNHVLNGVNLNDVFYSEDGTAGPPTMTKVKFSDTTKFEKVGDFWTYKLTEGDFTQDRAYKRIEIFVDFNECSGPNEGDNENLNDAALVYENRGYSLHNLTNGKSENVDMYFPMTQAEMSPEEALDFLGDCKRTLVVSHVTYGSTEQHIDYFQGYYYRPCNMAEFFIYNLEGKDLSQLSLTSSDLIAFPNGMSKTHSIVLREFDSQDKANQYINSNESKYYRLYKEENGSYVNKDINFNVRYDSERQLYLVCVDVAFTSFGRYYLCTPVFEERQNSNIDRPDNSVGVDGIVGQKSMMYYLEELLYQSGETIKLKYNNNYTVDTDLVMRNYSTNSGNIEIGKHDDDVLIDLNGSTLNLRAHTIEIEANSKIHIKNGTIIANGDAAINVWGALCLESITVDYNGTGNAINNYGYNLLIDQNSLIDSNGNGLRMASSSTKLYDVTNRVILFGKINATDKGVFIDSNNANDDYNFVLSGYNDGKCNDNGKDPTITAGTYGIYSTNKANIKIDGFDNNEDQNNRYMITSTIEAATALAVNGGKLELNCPSTVTSSGQGKPLIEVLASNADVKQEVFISVSYYNNATSNGPIVKVTGNNDMLNKLTIKYQSGTSNSKITYCGDPFVLKGYSPYMKITGGLFENTANTNKDNIKNYLTSGYSVNAVGNGYRVVADPNLEHIRFTYDSNNEQQSMAQLKSYFENFATASIDLDNDITPTGSYEFYVTSPKTVMMANHKINNVKFKVELEDNNDIFSFWNGSVTNNGTVLELISGMGICSSATITTTSNDPVIIQRGGEFGGESTATSINGQLEGIRIDAPNGASTSVNSNINAPNAINILNNLIDNNYGVYVQKGKDATNTPIVNGTITANNCRVVLMEGTINAVANKDQLTSSDPSAVTLTGNSQLILEGDPVVRGGESAIKVYDTGLVEIKDGTLSGFNVIEVMGASNNSQMSENEAQEDEFIWPTVRIMGRAHLATTDKENGSILTYASTSIKNDHSEVTSGFYNVPVNEDQFPNLGELRNRGSYNEYKYMCIQYANLTDDYPFTIIKKYTDNANSTIVNDGKGKLVDADQNQLEKIKNGLEDGEWTVMVARYLEEKPTAFDGYNIDQSVDIKINDIKPNGNTTSIEECDEYQFIELEVTPEEIEKIIIYHKHANDPVATLTKVTKDYGDKMLADNSKCIECYFVKDNKTICVVTKRFSIFATGISSDVVQANEDNSVETERIEFVDNIANVDSMNVVLSDKIAVNIYIEAKESEYLFNTAELHYTINDKNEKSVLIKDLQKENNLYVYTISLDSRQLNSSIKAWTKVDGDNGSVVDGSLSAYCASLSQSENTKVKALASALSNYCTYASKYFDKATSQTLLQNNHVDALNEYMHSITSSGSKSKIKLTNASLILGSTVSMKIYYSIGSGYDKDSFNYSVSDVDSSRINVTNTYMEIKNIKPSELLNKYTINISLKSNDEQVISMVYSPMSYAEQVNRLADNGNVNLKNLMNVMYTYAVAAKDYATPDSN